MIRLARCVCITESFCSTPETNTMLINYINISEKKKNNCNITHYVHPSKTSITHEKIAALSALPTLSSANSSPLALCIFINSINFFHSTKHIYLCGYSVHICLFHYTISCTQMWVTPCFYNYLLLTLISMIHASHSINTY